MIIMRGFLTAWQSHRAEVVRSSKRLVEDSKAIHKAHAQLNSERALAVELAGSPMWNVIGVLLMLNTHGLQYGPGVI